MSYIPINALSSILNLDPRRQHLPETVREKSLAYKTVSVVGLGYVGLPTALLFTRKGFHVQGVDISNRVLESIREGRTSEIYPELSSWWEEVSYLKTFDVSSSPEEADIFIITVPTPLDRESKTCDLSAVNMATDSIIPVLRKGNIVILESTVPPGTTRNLIKPKIEAAGFTVGEDIYLCFSPERILPGNTLRELVHNDRVLGGVTLESAFMAKGVLSRVIEGEIYITDDITAEFCKLAENTYRDVNIALANELSRVADYIGVNIKEALPIINRHPRVNLHQPGIGVGGHCIAVDPWFFVEAAPHLTPLISTARKVNDIMPLVSVEKILKQVENIINPKIVLAGLTYKPDVADIRESAAIEIVEILKRRNYSVTVYDPLLPEFRGQSLYDVIEGADLLAVLVNHSVIKAELSLNRHAIMEKMRTPNIYIF